MLNSAGFSTAVYSAPTDIVLGVTKTGGMLAARHVRRSMRRMRSFR